MGKPSSPRLRNILRYIALILSIPVILSACRKPIPGGSDKVYDYFQSQSFMGFFFESEYGYYYVSGGFVYYSEKDDPDFVKLCYKPDCCHDDENCNAFIRNAVNIHPYKDKIYYVYSSQDERNKKLMLSCMDFDGSDHRDVRILDEDVSISHSYIIHREYIFYVLEKHDKERDLLVSKLFYAKLDEDTGPSLITTVESPWENPSGIGLLAGRGNSFYYSDSGEIHRFDLGTKTSSELPGRDLVEKGRWFDEYSGYYFDLEDNYIRQDTLTGEKEVLAKIEDKNEYGPLFSDGKMWFRVNYLYGTVTIPDEYLGVFIYDMNGNKIDFIPYSMPTNNFVYAVITEKHFMLFRLLHSSSGFSIVSCSYFELEDIGTGDLEWTDKVA